MIKPKRKGNRYLAGLVVAFALLFFAIGTLGPARHSPYYFAIVPLPAAIALFLGLHAWSSDNERSAGFSAAALVLLIAVSVSPTFFRDRTRDRRHRLGPVQHRADPAVARPLGRQVPSPGFHRGRAGEGANRARHTRAGTLAKRFAAKEAFSKAVGTGFRRGVFMKDIGVVNLPSGAPTLQLTGGAKAQLDALAPEGHAIDIHLTMTDDHPWAQAFVILTARKLEP